jgi:hypothetical protein
MPYLPLLLRARPFGYLDRKGEALAALRAKGVAA